MKKLLAILIIAVMLISLAACSQKKVDGPSDDPAKDVTENKDGKTDDTKQEDSESTDTALKAVDGTLTLKKADLAIVIGTKTVSMPYSLTELADAGVPVSDSLLETKLASGDFYSPNLFIDENEDYVICPAYFNGGDAEVSITEADAGEISFFTYADAPADQNVSVLGVKFGMTKAELKELLGDFAVDEGDYVEWTVKISDAALEGNFSIYFTAEDGVSSNVCLSVRES